MSGFRLIGIFLLDNCSASIRKSLKNNTFYQFDQRYKITLNKGKFRKVLDVDCDKIQKIQDLYSFPGLDINISAIVGKNGSGKSSLLEILYACSFLLGEKYNKIDELFWLDAEKNPKQYVTKYHLEIAQELIAFKHQALFEIYFSNDGQIYRVVNDGVNQIQIEERKLSEGKSKWMAIENESLASYFYSIAINYSIYGLNEKSGPWLGSLFHKNDGYQTPLVINPYRTDGNIDVNNEYHLAQSRTLSNLSFLKNFELISKRNLEGVTFRFDPTKTLFLGRISFKNLIEIYEGSSGEKALDLFKDLYKSLFNIDYSFNTLSETKMSEILLCNDDKVYEFNEIESVDYVELEAHLIKYVIYKIFKLVSIDEEYKRLYRTTHEKHGMDFVTLVNTSDLINRISVSKSHLTLKIRQVLYSLKSSFFKNLKIEKIENEKNRGDKPRTFDYNINLSIKEYLKRQEDVAINIKEFVQDQLETVPVAYSKVTLYFNDYKSRKGDSPFHKLSSGEQQLILTLQTIYYHLYNLNSVEETDEKSKYTRTCLILDEVELYFHPEYQRKFIFELLNGIKKLKLPYINSLQILFSTHSPFILSDIPSSNILRLKDGCPEPNIKQTFAANIYDLLHDDFFLEDGVIGEFAKEQINKLLKKQVIYESDIQFVDVIGDPLLRGVISDKINARLDNDELIKQQIKKLKGKLNKRKNVSDQ